MRALREADLTVMERVTKLIVLAWVAVALAVEVWLLRGAWPRLLVIAPAAFTVTAIAVAFDRRAVTIVLALGYILPALLYRYLGPYYWQYGVLWMVLLVGAITPDALRMSWRVPSSWKGALICWALVTIVGTTIVVGREIDFTPALFTVTSVANTPGGVWPAFMITWVLNVALVTVIGILWLDWLLTLPPARFQSMIAMPLGIGVLIMAAVATYQLFGDIAFLNPTPYLTYRRAPGTIFDANLCGTIAALWIGGLAAFEYGGRSWPRYLSVGGIVMCWLAVWASGSRTAFAAAVIASVFALRAWDASVGSKAARIQVVTGAAAIGVLLLLLATTDLAAVGPLARFRSMLPALAERGISTYVVEELWNRNRYGTLSLAMIREYPLFGVGIGSFQSLLPEFAIREGGPLPPDNAQNWYRHQIAEFGLVGSVPWIVWLVGFGIFVLRRHAGTPASVHGIRGSLIAFAVMSFVGMPGQDMSVAITFWTFAAWYILRIGRPADTPPRRTAWIAIAVALAMYTAGTIHAATHDLRVPVRALRVGWPYTYGFYAAGSERDDAFRWTGHRAVAVVAAPARWMELTVSVDYRRFLSPEPKDVLSHAATRPVEVKLWRNGELVFDETFTTTAPVSSIVSVPDQTKWVLIETWVSRVFRPREFGVADDRELGALIKWTFLDRPPSGQPR